MQGTRKHFEPGEPMALREGEYGKAADGSWYGSTPGKHMAWLRDHQVTEHEDGTITVSPSILVSNGEGELWHGYLERGVWRAV